MIKCLPWQGVVGGKGYCENVGCFAFRRGDCKFKGDMDNPEFKNASKTGKKSTKTWKFKEHYI